MIVERAEAPIARGLLEELRLLNVREDCAHDPKALINEVRFFDPAQADDENPSWVEFKMFPPEGWTGPVEDLGKGEWKFTNVGAEDWYWQSLMIEWWNDPTKKKYLILKARQLGITLLACAYVLWLLLFRPGSNSVAYSYEEGEAKKLVQATWAMYQNLPDLFKSHVEVISPVRSEEPSEWIKLKHADGRISGFQALPATKKHGHGTRVTFAIMDEVARQDHARDIYAAINPATTRGRAKLVMISTANGVANLETGEGNYFHWLWHTRADKKLEYRFLPWNLEPTRDLEWYENEAMKLDDVERNQQYPLNERDAFRLSGATYFNREALDFYQGEMMKPVLTGQFVVSGRRQAYFTHSRYGCIDIFEKPHDGTDYAIGVDCASGRGSDYTSAHVIDLGTGAIVAEFHVKMEAPLAAVQLHYLGHWYNDALIAVERQGGYGDALIIALKDGNENRPPYARMYRHKDFTKGKRKIQESYGIPMGPKTRVQVLEGLKDWVHTRSFPWISAGTLDEYSTFVYASSNPSPRAQDGCNDDRVMSSAIAVEMFRQYGHHPAKRNRWKPTAYKRSPVRSH
jgi:hypothetical protein